jgi:hypothetical protein
MARHPGFPRTNSLCDASHTRECSVLLIAFFRPSGSFGLPSQAHFRKGPKIPDPPEDGGWHNSIIAFVDAANSDGVVRKRVAAVSNEIRLRLHAAATANANRPRREIGVVRSGK